jgi:hypothetical protein
VKTLLLIVLTLFPALAVAQPAIEFKTEKHDFGQVSQGPQLEYVFEFTNAGSDELVIQDVDTS